MTDTKFTPGPWTVPHFAQPDVACNCTYVLSEHQDHMGAIASVNYQSRDRKEAAGLEEASANARLIAAAPEMYELLTEVYAIGNEYAGYIEPSKMTLWGVKAEELLERINAEHFLEMTLEEALARLGEDSIVLVNDKGRWALTQWNEERDAYTWYSTQDWDHWTEAVSYYLNVPVREKNGDVS